MGYDVQIRRLQLNAVIDMQGKADAIAKWVKGDLPPFPEKPNTANESPGLSLYWIAPERWLLRSSIENPSLVGLRELSPTYNTVVL